MPPVKALERLDDQQAAAAMRAGMVELQEVAGKCDVLQKMDHRVLIGEIAVKDKGKPRSQQCMRGTWHDRQLLHEPRSEWLTTVIRGRHDEHDV